MSLFLLFFFWQNNILSIAASPPLVISDPKGGPTFKSTVDLRVNSPPHPPAHLPNCWDGLDLVHCNKKSSKVQKYEIFSRIGRNYEVEIFKDVLLRHGNGHKIMFHNFSRPFSFFNSRPWIVKNLSRPAPPIGLKDTRLLSHSLSLTQVCDLPLNHLSVSSF